MDLGKYRLPDLTHYRDDYYPIVIAIESLFPESYKGRAKKSMQFSCGAFAIEADNTFKFKLVKQKLLVSLTLVCAYHARVCSSTIRQFSTWPICTATRTQRLRSRQMRCSASV